MAGFDLMALAEMAGILLVTGACGGVVAGLLGVGGGIIVVPALFFVFQMMGYDANVSMFVAVGTSLATIIPTSLSSSRSHYKRDAVDVALLKTWSPAVFVGVVLGTLITTQVRGPFLTGMFGTLALCIAANILLRPNAPPLWLELPSRGLQWLYATFVGGISVMVGIGGGALSVSILSLYNYPIRRAVGTSSAMGMVIALPGTIGFMLNAAPEQVPPLGTIGNVNLIAFACVAPMTTLFAPLGAKIAHSIPPELLKKVFACFLVVMGSKMWWSVLH